MNNLMSVTRERANIETQVSTELNKVSTTSLAVSAAVIGCWATACILSAAASNGPANLFEGLVKSITG